MLRIIYNSNVKAVPKIDIQQDVSSGVQKFRAKILSKDGGQTNMDVLCQVKDPFLSSFNFNCVLLIDSENYAGHLNVILH